MSKRISLTFLLTVVLLAGAMPAISYGQNAPVGTTPGNTPSGTTPGNTPSGTTPGNTPSGVTPSGEGLTNPIRFNSLPELLEAILAAIVQIGTIILILALVYVGFLFVVAQGSEEKIRDAKSALLWTIIGGLILLGASAIGAVIGETVNSIRPS